MWSLSLRAITSCFAPRRTCTPNLKNQARDIDSDGCLLTPGENLTNSLFSSKPNRGHEAAQGIPEEQGLRIVALTAMSLADVRDRALEVGMQDFLHKPFSTETLIEKLANNPQVEG